MNGKTVLYIPAPERVDEVLGASVGGGTVPMLVEWRTRANGPVTGTWAPGPGCPLHWRRALVLSLAGKPDAIGMGRARDVLADLDASGHFNGVRFKAGAVVETWALFGDAYGNGGTFEMYGSQPGWRPAIPALRGVTDTPLALAIILASRLGGSVVVLDG